MLFQEDHPVRNARRLAANGKQARADLDYPANETRANFLRGAFESTSQFGDELV